MVCTIIQGFGAYGRGDRSVTMKKTERSPASGPRFSLRRNRDATPLASLVFIDQLGI